MDSSGLSSSTPILVSSAVEAFRFSKEFNYNNYDGDELISCPRCDSKVSNSRKDVQGSAEYYGYFRRDFTLLLLGQFNIEFVTVGLSN